MSSTITTGSYLANVAMIGGISIDSSTKKYEYLAGGGDNADSATQLLAGFSGSSTGSVIAALNHVYEQATTGQVSTSGNNTFSGNNLFSGKLSASNGVEFKNGAQVILSAPDLGSGVTIGNSTEQLLLVGSAVASQSPVTFGAIITASSGLAVGAGDGIVAVTDSSADIGASGTAFKTLYVDDIDLNGQGNISMGGTGRIDLDANDNTSIRASADDVITFELGGADKLDISATAIHPESDALMDLGTSAIGFNDLHLGSGGVINLDGGDVTMTHAAGKLTFGGDGAVEIDFNNHEMTNVDINSGAIDGTNVTVGSGKTLDVSGGTLTTSAAQKAAIVEGVAANVDIGAYDLRAQTLTADSLTSGRVPFASTNGLLIDDSDFTFATDTLTVTKIGAFEAAGAINFASQAMTNVDINSGAVDGISTLSVGTDGAGGDVTFHSATAGDYMMWDASEEKLVIVGTSGQVALDVDTGNLTVGAYGLTDAGAATIASMAGNWTNAGRTVADMGIVTTIDINGGSIDGANIGAASRGTAAFTTLDANGNVTLGSDHNDVTTINGELTASMGMLIKDNKKLYFGDGFDASIEYDEDGDDELKFAGAAVAFAQAVSFDANVTLGNASTDVTTVTGLLSASQDITLASGMDVNFQGGGGPVIFDSEDNQYYRIEVQGGLMVLSPVGEDFRR